MKPLWKYRLPVSVAAAILWTGFEDTLDLLVNRSWTYDWSVNTLSGIVLGVVVWYALLQEAKHAKGIEERYHLCRTLAHHISNPVQILLNRDHLPPEEKDTLIDKAIHELVEACRDIIPRLK